MSGASAAIYDNANRPTVALANPLDLYGRAGQVTAGINANKLFQAQQAAGQAYQQATDPSTGIVDPRKAQALIAANPQAALAAQGSATSGQELAGQQLKFNTDQQQRISGQIGSLLSQPDEAQTRANYATLAEQELQAGTIDQQHYQAVMQSMPADGAPPQAFKQFGIRALVGTLGGPQMAATVFPSNQDVNDGASNVPMVRQAPLLGGARSVASGAVPLQLSPGEKVQTQPIVGPGGAPGSQPVGSKYDPYGNLAGGQSALGTGRPIPPSLRGPNAQAAPASAPAPAGPAGFTPTGMTPAAASAASTTGAQSAAAFKDINDQGVAAQSRGAVLDNMLSDTGQFTTGPLAGIKQKVRAMAQQLGASVDTDKLSASESFTKLAAQLNQSQGSDARLAVSQAGNPHADLSPAGIDLMLRQLRGNEDYLQARKALAAKQADTSDIRGFENTVGSKLDPRAFQYDRMTGAQKKTYFNSLPSNAAKDAFIKAHDATTALLSGGQ